MPTDRRRAPVRADDDDTVYSTFLGFGTITTLEPPGDDRGEVAGKLYLPDPEQRHGFREYYVHREPARQKPGARPIGFGRP